ncbi:MAG: acyltransferase domain-containing protein, partial [Pseudomonadota bacterium]
GYSPASVGLFEAHGTGTVAGDTAELETVIRVLDEAGAQPRSTVIGSVKTLIGHTKGTAGIAGLVKTALAVYHGVQPPHANVTHPNERIARDDCPVTLLPAPRPWVTPPGAPRRASVSAFGFGGTNFHVTMEQYLGDYLPELKPARRSRWPAELLVWRGADAAALAAAVRATAGWLATNPAPALRDLAWTLQHRAPAEGLTACLVAATVDDLPARLTALAAHVVEEAAPLPDDAYFSREPLAAQGKLAVVFAGQGSQYPGMLRQVAVAFDDVAVTLAAAEATLGRPFSALAYPAGCYDAASERAAAEALAAPGDGLPTLAAVQIGMLNLFRRLGVAPAMAAGHSFGEHAALHAAGALELADVFRLAQARGDVLSAASDSYALARVACDYAALAEAAAEVGDVWVASHTAPGKCAVSGVRSAVLAVLDRLGLSAQTQPTSMAVHTPLAAAQARRLFRETPPESCNTPKIPVYCNATGQPYPEAPDALLAEFAQQMARPVRFVEQIEAMYADGARIFLGLGPRNGQGSPIVDILGDRPCLAVHVDDGEGGMKGLLRCAGALLAEGVALDLEALNGGRNCALLDLHRPGPGGPGERRGKRSPRHCWLLNGSQARPAGEAPREPLRHVAQADSTMDFKTQVPEEKGTGEKWESNTMSTSARDLPAQLLEPAADEAQEMLVADERDVVFQAYQDTMRQFLASQESVMLAYLGGAGATATSALPAPAAPRRLAAPRTVVRRPAPIPMRVAEPPVATAPASRPAAPAPVAAPVAAPVVEAPAPTPVASKPVAAPPAAPAPAPAPAAPAATTGGSLDAENVRKQLLELVEERTGYPQDMLDLDQHIEADLGIDSIKRVEIVGALIKTLPADVVSANSGLSDELNSQTTLQGMIDLVSQQGGLAAASNQ